MTRREKKVRSLSFVLFVPVAWVIWTACTVLRDAATILAGLAP